MPKATDTPSARTRRLIQEAHDRGIWTERSVVMFSNRIRRAVVAFNADVDPLHLSDESYEHVALTSGLDTLLRASQRIADHLLRVSERAA